MTAELRELYKLGVNSTWLSLLSYVLTFAISIITSLFPEWRASQNIGISSSAWLCLHRSLNNSNFTWSVADNNTVPDLSTILSLISSLFWRSYSKPLLYYIQIFETKESIEKKYHFCQHMGCKYNRDILWILSNTLRLSQAIVISENIGRVNRAFLESIRRFYKDWFFYWRYRQ